ncbi:hypothetical protein KZC52_07170 [Microbacterium sp. kSW2-24]|uniref:hypothetical protein n=1 Tax=Microbacterium galbinum TaxID=2851646 RepID=UPI001FFC9B16|nr:hypothetical protein [Microbacterium galbinum]MCK2022698.1 hypothetical protein [Microbacterium galbinum]
MARDVIHSWWHPRNTSVEQLSLSEEIAGLPRLIDVMAALSSPRMAFVLDGDLTGRSLAGILMRMGDGVACGLDVPTLIAAIDPTVGVDARGDRPLPEEQVQMVVSRASTIHGALRRHRDSRALFTQQLAGNDGGRQ